MNTRTKHSAADEIPTPPLYDRPAVAAWLAARRRIDPRRDAAGPRRVAGVITVLASTGVPFTARDVSELAEVHRSAVASALRSARIAGEIRRVELSMPTESAPSTLWLGSSHGVPSGYRDEGPILF